MRAVREEEVELRGIGFVFLKHTYIQTNLYSAKIVETNQRRWYVARTMKQSHLFWNDPLLK